VLVVDGWRPYRLEGAESGAHRVAKRSFPASVAAARPRTGGGRDGQVPIVQAGTKDAEQSKEHLD
jgi:hypothetical protein